jgi:hypothetical protein
VSDLPPEVAALDAEMKKYDCTHPDAVIGYYRELAIKWEREAVTQRFAADRLNLMTERIPKLRAALVECVAGLRFAMKLETGHLKDWDGSTLKKALKIGKEALK